MDEERKVISRARDRLRDARLKFALEQRLPKRYQAIISDTCAHSDDEYNSKKGVYDIKTLPFRSENATKFFRRLDAAMLKADGFKGKRVQRRKRLPPKPPQDTIFPKPPKGLPLDFYDPDWFNDLLPQQKLEFADTRKVAFLPDADKSLMGKQLAIEKLSDKQFVNKFFDQISKPYDLTHEIENFDEDDGETDNEDDESFAGEEIDLAHTSGSDEEEEEMNDEDADFVDDEEMESAEEENDEGDADEDDADRDARYNAMLIDEDLPNW